MSQPQPDVIEQLVTEMRALRSAVERLTEERHGPRVSLAAHSVLSAIFNEVGNKQFTSGELLSYAAAQSAPLLSALADAGATTPKRAGKLFAKVKGRNLSGLSIDRVAHESAGIVWTITHNVSVFPEVSNATKHID
jgi:hypothetical protein